MTPIRRQNDVDAARKALEDAATVYKLYGQPYGELGDLDVYRIKQNWRASKLDPPYRFGRRRSKFNMFNDKLDLPYYATADIKLKRLRSLKRAARRNPKALRQVNPELATPVGPNANGPPEPERTRNRTVRALQDDRGTLPAVFAPYYADVAANSYLT